MPLKKILGTETEYGVTVTGPGDVSPVLVASMLVGYVVPRLFRVDRKQAIAIGMEIGIHNGTLAIAIASLLDNSVMAIPAAVYSVIMFFTAAAFGFYVARRP